MAKTRSTAMLVLSALALIGAAMLASADRAMAQGEPMSFRLAKLEGRSCGARCPQVIVAEGVIEEDTPETFLSFLQSTAGTEDLRDVVVINSPGGRVVASMRLGAALRKLRAAVIVARFGNGGDLDLPTAGSCMSACVYAMMGGVKRVVPPESRLGIHRMSSLESGGVGGRAFAAPTPTYASQDMVTALASYAQQMGVNPAVIRLAEQIPPEEIHILSAADMRRWRLASPKF